MGSSRRLIAFMTAVCLGACSVGMKKLPRGWQPTDEPACDSSATRPLVDASVGGAGLSAAGYLFWRYPPGLSGDGPCAVCPTVPALLLAAAGFLLVLSSLDGFGHMRRCRKAIRTRAERRDDRSRAHPRGRRAALRPRCPPPRCQSN